MALARLAVQNLQQRVVSPYSALLSPIFTERALSNVQKQRWGSELVKRLSTAAGEEKSEGREVSVAEGGKKSKLFPKKQRRGGLWRTNNRDFVPALHEFFPSGLGNAILQATENINRLLGRLTPSQLMGRIKEKDEYYKLIYHVPGLAKEDLKITVEDGVLKIRGEHKEEEEEGSDDEYWSSRSYGYYNTTLMLPEDAKVDEIKAEIKDGVLCITIPRTEMPKKEVKEVPVH